MRFRKANAIQWTGPSTYFEVMELSPLSVVYVLSLCSLRWNLRVGRLLEYLHFPKQQSRRSSVVMWPHTLHFWLLREVLVLFGCWPLALGYHLCGGLMSIFVASHWGVDSFLLSFFFHNSAFHGTFRIASAALFTAWWTLQVEAELLIIHSVKDKLPSVAEVTLNFGVSAKPWIWFV